MGPSIETESALPPLRALRTIRFAVRAAWDALGLVCAASLTLFMAVGVAIFLALISIPLGLLAGCLLVAPLFAGACFLAHKFFENDEPGYLHLLEGFRRLYFRSVALAAAQTFGFALLVTNLEFYGRRNGFGFLLATAGVLYVLVFWAMNCLYHYPLLVAAGEGIIRRDEGGRARFRAVLRNGLLMALSTPGYSLGILVFLIAVTTPLVISAVGMALVGCAFPAFLCARAARDQFIHHRLIPADPDPDEPAKDEVWRMGG